jgi:hypothetical protein
MATLAAVRAGLKTRLETIAGLQVYATPPDSIVVPAAVIFRDPLSYDRSFDGVDDFAMKVSLFVQRGVDHTSLESLDAYVDPAGTNSVVAAIHADTTLGGAVDYARVTSASPEGLVEYAGVFYLSCDLSVEIGD